MDQFLNKVLDNIAIVAIAGDKHPAYTSVENFWHFCCNAYISYSNINDALDWIEADQKCTKPCSQCVTYRVFIKTGIYLNNTSRYRNYSDANCKIELIGSTNGATIFTSGSNTKKEDTNEIEMKPIGKCSGIDFNLVMPSNLVLANIVFENIDCALTTERYNCKTKLNVINCVFNKSMLTCHGICNVSISGCYFSATNAIVISDSNNCSAYSVANCMFDDCDVCCDFTFNNKSTNVIFESNDVSDSSTLMQLTDCDDSIILIQKNNIDNIVNNIINANSNCVSTVIMNDNNFSNIRL